MNLVGLRKIFTFKKKNKELGGMPENKDIGFCRTLEGAGLERTQDPRRVRTLEDPGP